MAGIGFELKKLYSEKGIILGLRAFLYSFVVTIGPMILCILLITGMQELLERLGESYVERQVMMAVIEYAFIFSLLLSGGVAMYLSRFFSDMIFNQRYNEILPGLDLMLMITLGIGTLMALPFLYFSELSFLTALLAYMLFMVLILVWLYAIVISALKDYRRIFGIYCVGILVGGLICLGMALAQIHQSDYYLFAVVCTFSVIGSGMMLYVRKVFQSDLPVSYEVIKYLGVYGKLVGVGFFMNGGIYVHNMIYWFSESGEVIKNTFYIASFYDVPMFYAFLTIIPSMVMFVVMFETNFYDKYRDYYNQVIYGGGYKEMENAKSDMIKALFQEFSGVMEMQLFFTIISLLMGRIFLPMIGLQYGSIDIFSIITLGCFIYSAVYIIVMVLLYFDDIKGALRVSAVFFFSNGLLTLGSLYFGVWARGFGFFLSAALTFFIGFHRLNDYLKNLDYYTYCNQPLLAVAPKAWATKSAHWLEYVMTDKSKQVKPDEI